ncbi:hypothetical protein EHP00_507 [Ecytonucleospora hepatopenaei]|uniref:Uncharacterized protein n=1 Tax=Ecytonucleospora hepatopenaei TaxID=646526 RepID=A0A1W0E458_9MICR|nr:hypothetical protein EHP00_507 [Ecytonucleospora hepatopenaei]
MLIKEYDEIFDKNFDVLKIAFTIDFQTYNRFLTLEPFYSRKIEKIGILNFIPFEKYQEQVNEINLIYLQWLSFASFKNYVLDYTQIKNSILNMFIKQ